MGTWVALAYFVALCVDAFPPSSETEYGALLGPVVPKIWTVDPTNVNVTDAPVLVVPLFQVPTVSENE